MGVCPDMGLGWFCSVVSELPQFVSRLMLTGASSRIREDRFESMLRTVC